MNLKRIFHDDRTWPNAIHQLVFGDEFPCRLGQHFDDLKSAPTDRDGGTKDAKLATSEINLALARGVDGSNIVGGHAIGLRRGLDQLVRKWSIRPA
jgi:hypothetical protein